MTIATVDARQNELLAELPDAELARLLPHLERIDLWQGEVLYQPGNRLTHVYFPTTSSVALFYALEDGASTQIAVVGREGLVGISRLMGAESTPTSAVVQSDGHAYRLKANILMQELDRGGVVLHGMLRFAQALITQIAQIAVCNCHHSLDQRLCRLLLFSLDRVPSKDLTMTHELIANMLGVRREGVTGAAGRLQRAGLVQCRRGHITVLDHARLSHRSCECYGVVKKAYDCLLPASMAVA